MRTVDFVICQNLSNIAFQQRFRVLEKQLKLTARDLGYTDLKPEIIKNFVGIM